MTPTSPVPPYPTPRGLLTGKTVVVTAAAGTGIGFAVAKRAAEEGAKLLISDFHERRLGEAADRIADEAGVERPATFVCDVTDEQAVQGLRDASLAALGRVDVLINNAGLGGEVDVVDMTDDQWNRVLDVTLTSLFRMTRAFLPHMYANKAGVMAFTRCSAIEAAEHGVRINAVAPSLAMHPFLAKVTTQEMLDKLVEKEAFKRPAEVWEVANVMLFLASDLSSYMTGEILPVSSQKA